jgi:hypothetical protein
MAEPQQLNDLYHPVPAQVSWDIGGEAQHSAVAQGRAHLELETSHCSWKIVTRAL